LQEGALVLLDEKGTVIEIAQSIEKSPDEYHTTILKPER
jgi:hypothetical protein